jgi:LCP family protein required for cell wall assembly
MSTVEEELRAAFERHEVEVPPVTALRDRIEVAGVRARRRRTRRRVAGAALVAVAAALVPAVMFQPWQRLAAPGPVAGLVDCPVLSGPVDVLLIGSDNRAGWTPDNRRADTVMLLHVPADRGAAYMISLPRDGSVRVPGRGPEKLNTTLMYGGPQLTTEVVEELTGVEVDATVTVDFRALRRVTAAVGGVTMCLREDALPSGFRAGCQQIDESKVVTLLRDRRAMPKGAFDRDRNNQRFLRALAGKVIGERPDADRLRSLLDAAGDGVQVDGDRLALLRVAASLDRPELIGIAQTSRVSVRLPTQQEVIFPRQGRDLFRAVRDDRLAEWAAANPEGVER